MKISIRHCLLVWLAIFEIISAVSAIKLSPYKAENAFKGPAAVQPDKPLIRQFPFPSFFGGFPGFPSPSPSPSKAAQTVKPSPSASPKQSIASSHSPLPSPTPKSATVTPNPSHSSTPSSSPSSSPASADPCKGFRANRKEILDMTTAEYNAYVNAVNAVDKSGVMDTYVGYHSTYANLAHGGCLFLPWHRQYLFEFERELNKISPGISIPYWDWTKTISGSTEVDAAFTDDTVWNLMGGGNGYGPIPNSPFKNWQVGTLAVNRDFYQNNGAIGGQGYQYSFASRQMIAAQEASQDAFSDFSTLLESQHGTPHVAIGGNMGQVPTSPSDPMFFSHHAYVDKIWSEWQKSGNGNKFGGTQPGYSCSLTAQPLPPFGRSVQQVFDELQQCTTYTPTSRSGPTTRFDSLGGNTTNRQATGNTGGGSALSFGPQTKQSYLMTVAKTKSSDPATYRAELVKGLAVLDSTNRAARIFGLSQTVVDQAAVLFQNLLLSLGVDVVGDKNLATASDQAISSSGTAQVASLQKSSS